MKSVLSLCTRKELLLPLIFGIFYSLASNIAGWDLAFQDHFWNEDAGSWTGPTIPIFRWLYYFGVIPALVVAVGSLFVIALSFSLKSIRVHRKVATFLFLILVIGNGIITNGMLKEYWGRPRPSDLTIYEGSRDFEPSLILDRSSEGKSFPCGHATMGFYFFGVALLFQKKQRLLVGLAAGLYGVAIGLSRASYGAHFLTDCIWAGVVMWLTSYLLHRALGLDRSLYYEESTPTSKWEAILRNAGRIFIFPLFLLVVIGIGVATPRDKTKYLELQVQESHTFHQRLVLKLEGILKIETDKKPPTVIFVSKTKGFGFPKSVLLIREKINDFHKCSEVFHQKQGVFTELNATTRLILPEGYLYEILLSESDLVAVYVDRRSLVDPPSILKIDLR